MNVAKDHAKKIFCVGNRARELVKCLVLERLIPRIEPRFVNHYSGRSTDERIIAGIVNVVGESGARVVQGST